MPLLMPRVSILLGLTDDKNVCYDKRTYFPSMRLM